jgi:hypothetical protein
MSGRSLRAPRFLIEQLMRRREHAGQRFDF